MGTYRKVGEGLHNTLTASSEVYHCGKNAVKDMADLFSNILDTAVVIERSATKNGERRVGVRYGNRTTKMEEEYLENKENLKSVNEKEDHAPIVVSVRKVLIGSAFLTGLVATGGDSLEAEAFKPGMAFGGLATAIALIKPEDSKDSIGKSTLNLLNQGMKRAHLNGVKLSRKIINYDKTQELRKRIKDSEDNIVSTKPKKIFSNILANNAYFGNNGRG